MWIYFSSSGFFFVDFERYFPAGVFFFEVNYTEGSDPL
jgi:hypothetical protein